MSKILKVFTKIKFIKILILDFQQLNLRTWNFY